MQKYTYRLLFGGKRDGRDYQYNLNKNLLCILNYRNGKLDGKSTYYYQNGTIKCIIQFKDDKPLSIIKYNDMDGHSINDSYLIDGNGYLRTYYEDGSIKSEGRVKNGVKDGEWKSYYQSNKSTIDYSYFVNGKDQYGFTSKIIF
jgi:antitoxin component YwqK of YwqJK toxin-antitoxin module